MFNFPINKKLQRILCTALAAAMCIGALPSVFAAQVNSYHDPAESWLSVSSSRTNELDANAVVTQETFYCDECGDYRSFTVWRTPEYTKDGATALSRNVRYSDGTFVDGSGTGSILDGTPGVDAYYTGYHWTKAVCDTCGTINANLGSYDYGFGVNVYWLYDCDANFIQELEEETTYEYVSSDYHKVTTTGGSYCGFCYGTCYTEESELERHNMDYTVTAEQGNLRFVRTGVCADCGYTTTEYATAKAVIQSYLGTVDGDAHTIVVSDLSDSSVSVSIRYGLTADSCTLTTAPTYTEAGTNYVYYAITYTYKDAEMTENGVAYVTLVEAANTGSSACSCGCGDADCDCTESSCSGSCCGTCSGCSHSNYYSYTIDPTCTALGYTKYICLDCGAERKSDYVSALGHLYQYFTTSEATCETAGKTIGICLHCGLVTTETTDKTDHKYSTYTVAATCTSPGYTVHECSVCGDRYISDITAILSHSYTAVTTAATCTTSGKTVYTCADCGSSYVGSYVAAYGHNYVATEITAATCGGAGVTQYKCSLCGDTYLVAENATGHTLSTVATCTEAQYCLECGAIITLPTGHDYTAYVTEPTCTEGGYTTHTCDNCGDSYIADYTEAHGHTFVAENITLPTCNGAGVTQYTCTGCGEHYLEAESATGHNINGEATCTEASYCLDCGAILALPTGHNYEAVVTEPTCTEDGYTTYTCVNCGDSYIADETEHLRHDYVGESVILPSCDHAGVSLFTCSRCGDWYMLAEDAEGHTAGEPATCTTPQLCTVCGAVLALPTGHEYEATVTEPTCTEQGYTTYICIYCGDTYTDNYTEATGHTPGDWIVDKQPTLDYEGSRHKECEACGETTDSETLDKLPREAVTDSSGEAVVGRYLVIVTDTSSKKPISGATVKLNTDGTISVTLPSSRLLSSSNKTTVTVLWSADNSAVRNMNVTVTDRKSNSSSGKTDSYGQLTVPNSGSSDSSVGGSGSKTATTAAAGEQHSAYIVGYPDGTFGPELGMTRAEAAAIFARLLAAKNGESIAAGAATAYTDVDSGAWYSGYIAYLSAYGIIYGIGDGTFAPDNAITRAEFTAMAVRFFSTYGGTAESTKQYTGFKDVSSDCWALDYIKEAVCDGWVQGYDDGTFRAEANITRAEVVTVVNRLLSRTADESYISKYYYTLTTFSDLTSKHWAYYAVLEAANGHTAKTSGGSESWS
ncbi:MAG: S-layer homology domain-containing protein [Lachnospiraceae bacterium]|nr:S-layer homology domain-containing protein [Lachnospiraceae bacterium]